MEQLQVVESGDLGPLQRPPGISEAGLPPPHPKHGEPVALYPYTDLEGELLYYVARYEPDGRKVFSPWRWHDGKWIARVPPAPRPLYGLTALSAKPDARVLLVEGEKAADAVRPLLTGFAVLTWPGGAQAVNKIDFTPLKGRAVDLWPDADDAGKAAMAKVVEKLAALGVTDMRRIDPEGRNSGWDAADAVAEFQTAKAVIAWIKRDGGQYLQPVVLPSSGELVSDSAGADRTPEQACNPLSQAASVTDAAPAPNPSGTLQTLLSIKSEDQRWREIGVTSQIMQNGRPPCNEDVVYRFCNYLKGSFWYDSFLMRIMTTWGSETPIPVDDDVIYKMTVFFQSELAMQKMSRDKVKGGLMAYGVNHRRNIAQEWLHSLSWDGAPRLEVMLPIAFGTDDDDYHAAVGRCFMVGMCNRILKPGCQMDNMLVLESPEGYFKSTALKILGGDWFAEAHYPVTHTDFYQCLQGKMLVELSEMSSLENTSVDKIKACITRRTDNYRRSYGMLAGDYPRQCVFTATTNRDDWNQSDTGARRFWRVKVGMINTQWLIDNRGQLFAEAAHRARMDECYWDVPAEKQKALMKEARAKHPWEEHIEHFMSHLPETRPYAKASEVFEALNVTMDKQNTVNLRTISAILRAYGYETKTTREHGSQFKAWHKTRLGVVGPEPASRADEGTLQETGPEFIFDDQTTAH